MQEQHRSISTKCVGLELAKVSANEKQELLKSSVAKLEKKVAAYKKPPHTTHQAPPPAFSQVPSPKCPKCKNKREQHVKEKESEPTSA